MRITSSSEKDDINNKSVSLYRFLGHKGDKKESGENPELYLQL